MDADKFIDIAYKCGYSTKGNAKKYVKDNPKEDYDMDDLIVLHEGKMRWCGVAADRGLKYVEAANGKTTSFGNGLSGNSGARQDWGM